MFSLTTARLRLLFRRCLSSSNAWERHFSFGLQKSLKVKAKRIDPDDKNTIPLFVKVTWLIVAVETAFYFAVIQPQMKKLDQFDDDVGLTDCQMTVCGMDS
ncbi:hypothetical protein QR680_007617 [Steinernema hermaphroditum]|uniref:Uncharacterized protein n=1 Tax=Steinernema hermaphroditum TaxID=289476 RepID=A0AA39IDQ4_9BILA|nr:hypothetical protein QR680_007617 [Steinernema hermaphroditum]